jgi:hypothetical protein
MKKTHSFLELEIVMITSDGFEMLLLHNMVVALK